MGFRFPVALNPFKSRVPTTRLGAFGKAINPLNPVNAATMILEEAIGGVVGKALGPEARQRVEYFGYGGVLPGIALNILDAGAVSANQDQLVKQAQAKYLQEQKQQRAQETRVTELAAPQQTRSVAGSPAVRRPVEESRPPVSRVMPASPNPPQRREPETMNELAQLYAEQYRKGREMEQGGELQRRLMEGGAVPGMSPEALMTWVEANPDLAYRLAEKRGLLPEMM
jgi:hypothetical protein